MREEISFRNSRNQVLRGVAHIGDAGERRPWLILCHGMFSSKNGRKVTRLAEEAGRAGLNAFRFDFTACGESEGEPGLILYSQQVRDVSGAVDVLDERYHASRLCLVGSSMGAATVILHAASRPYKIASLVLIAAPSDTLLYVKENMTPEQREEWKGAGVMQGEGGPVRYEFYDDAAALDVVAAARLLHFPTLVVHGDRDELVPLRCAREIFEALPYTKSLTVMHKADHQFSNPEDTDRLVQLTLNWSRLFSRQGSLASQSS
ncbi:MAG: alpha/beta hydrolase [Nitrospirae bacterium]|nr:alpha/beta hydrolase [Nitrospirota bacterium]